MLYLKSLSIDRFKSFKHVNLLFNKGFNCIVGPNGSGKSNICDAILFCLGESSLHRLRVNRLEYLINSGRKKTSALAKAHVRVEFDGDEKISMIRGLRSDGKTAYRLNGKRMTRQEVLEVLKKHQVHVDETSTITQGEINKLTDLNPKERRELIELAAGIKEFEYKKKEAMSELEKVSARVSEAQVMLSERLTFLNELAKEKAAAEKYTEMSKRLRALNYSVLSKRRDAVQSTLNTYFKSLAALETKRKEIESESGALMEKTTKLSDERQKLTKVLSESSSAIGDTNKRLEAIGGELSALEVRVSTGNSEIEEAGKRIDAAQKSVKEIEDKTKRNEVEMGTLKNQIQILEASAKKLGSARSDTGSKAVDRVKGASETLQKLETEVIGLQGRLAKLNANRMLIDSGKENAAREAIELESDIEDVKKTISESKERARGLKDKKEQTEKQLAKAEAQGKSMDSELSRLESDLLELKEQRAMSRPRESMLQEKLKHAFGKGSGFHGTAAELCSYDTKHAAAVEAAAGGRFNYLVVESMSVANSMIDYLKRQSLGRATFIPIQELRVEEGGRDKDKGIVALVDLLGFDEKFRKVFAYMFSDTYLVESVDEAKRIGVGRHRYATISGETVEKSGVLSGGSAPKFVAIALLDKKLTEMEKARQQMHDDVRANGEVVFGCRKEIASVGIEMSSLTAMTTDFEAKLKDLAARTADIKSESSRREAESKKTNDECESLEKDLKEKSEELRKGREELVKSYDETLRESMVLAKSGVGKEELEKLESLRKETEALRIKSAETQKENNMLTQNREKLIAEMSKDKERIGAAQHAVSLEMKKKTELEKSRERIQQEVKNSNKSSREAYDRLNTIEAEMLVLSREQGRLNASSDEVSKRFNDTEVRRGQMEVRLNDIKAELAAYGNAEADVIDEDPDEMEKEAHVLGVKINDLGAVNLKAPEIYAEKKRSVDEANEKVNTLETERRAVISMIEEIDSKKLNSFIATFDEVNKNFSKLYNYIFPGAAQIELEDANNPLETGIGIRIDTGKSLKRVGSLSGGEKSLVSLMLIFAIHMRKPSSLYLFDEIDVSLDKENSKKLSQLIKEMSSQAQFIVVSHNDSLIVNADAAIGVVKTEEESKVVGIEISSVKSASS